MLYLLYKVGLFVLRLVAVDAAYSLVFLCAKIKYYVSRRDREIVKANLRTVLPHAGRKEVSVLAEDVFRNFGKYLVDFFALIKNQKDYIENTIRFIGLENLDEALKLGRGCIIIAGHFGNWELAGCAVANLGYKINVVALKHRDPRINNIFISQRKKAGINVIPTGNARSACQRALLKNEIIAILGDRPYGDHGVKVKFFGKTTVVPRGAALLSLKHRSPIVTTFAYKEDTKKNIHTFAIDKPFLIEREGRLTLQLETIAQKFMERFEHYIRRYPTQWYMFNKVWED